MKKHKKILVVCLILCYLVFLGINVYRTGLRIECYMCQKSICSYLPAYRQDNNEQNPSSLGELRSSFPTLEKGRCVCPVSKKEFLYLPGVKNGDDIILADSSPCHYIERKNISGVFDFFTLNFFAPKGRVISYNRYMEGALTEDEFQKKIEKQKESELRTKTIRRKPRAGT